MKKTVCVILALTGILFMSMNVYADEYDEEYYDDEQSYTEEYDDYEDYEESYDYEEYTESEYNEEEYSYEESVEYIEDYTEESYYYEEETVSQVSEEIIEEVSPAAESMEESSQASLASQTETSVTSKAEISAAEKSEISKTYEPKVLNAAAAAEKDDNKADSVSGSVMWGIVLLAAIFSIIFLPRTNGISSIKERYRYRKAQTMTRRHTR